MVPGVEPARVRKRMLDGRRMRYGLPPFHVLVRQVQRKMLRVVPVHEPDGNG